MKRPLDPGFTNSFGIITNLARNRGLDLAEVLNDHGMLRTDEAVKQDQMIALRSLRDRFAQLRAEILVAIVPQGANVNLTPADMLRYAQWWVNEFVDLWEES